MSELKAEEVVISKKSIWKNKAVWIVGILVVLFFAYKMGSSSNVPEGIGENYYSNALWAFHELNKVFENGDFPSGEVTESIADNVRAVESDPSNYTEKEKYISEQFTKMLLGIGNLYELGENQGFEEQIYEARTNLAEVLEVDEDY